MTIDMHSHWRPPALIAALRARKTPPLIMADDDGVDVLHSRRGDTPLSEAFDNLEERLAVMNRRGISTAALSLFGGLQWIERLPAEESLPLVRLYNDEVSAMSVAHPGRFVAYASLPQADMDASVAEFDRAMELPGIVGAILPGNAFMTYEDVESYRPLLAAANRHRALVFIHWGPRPGDQWPRVTGGADNFSPRLGTLDMQASLSSNMMTLCYTDILDDYPDLRVHIHNLGGNIPYEIGRLDHRNVLDTPEEPLPSTRFVKPNLFVDCNSFGKQAIELGVAAYGAEKIVFGTDGTDFGCEWSDRELAAADIGDDAKHAILHDNAAALLSDLAPIAPFQVAAE